MSDLDRLDDYVRGVMRDDEAASFEEELFARAASGGARELVYHDGLRATVREMVAEGTFELYVTAKDVGRLLASGRRIQQVEVENKRGEQRYLLDREAELFIARFAPVDLTRARSVDIEIWDGDRLSKVMKDVTFDAADHAVFFCCHGDLARSTVGMTATSKMYANEEAGRRLVAEVTTLGELAPST